MSGGKKYKLQSLCKNKLFIFFSVDTQKQCIELVNRNNK